MEDARNGGEVLDESLTIRLSSTLKSRITEAARKDRRRPGDWVRLKLEEAVEETRREQP
jgi:predicted transcriptional regulator